MESRGGEDFSPRSPSRSLHSFLINKGMNIQIATEDAFCNRHDAFCVYRIGVRTHCVSLIAQIGGRCMLRFLQRDAISVEKEKISQILNQTSIFSIPAGVWEAMAGTKVWFIWGPSYLTCIIALHSSCCVFSYPENKKRIFSHRISKT